MLCGHIDTVGVAGMARAVRRRWSATAGLHGRGAQDMKGGVAAMIDAARAVAEGGGLAAGRVIVACVVDEEHASLGADALVTALARRRRRGHRADRSRHRGGAQGLRVGRGRDGRPRRARQPAGRRPSTRSCTWAACCSRSRRSIATLQARRARIRCWARRRCTPRLIERRARVEQLSRSVHAAIGAADVARRARRLLAGEVAALLARLAAADPAFAGRSRPLFSRPPYEIPPAHPCRAC